MQFFVKITEDWFFILLIKNKITLVCKPISTVEIDRLVCQLITVRIVEMGENKIVDGFRLQHLAGVTDLRFLLIPEDKLLSLMGHSALMGEEASDPEGDARVQHTVCELVGLEGKHRLDKPVAPLLATDTITMTNHTAFAVHDKQLGVLKDLAAYLLREEILKPHIVVTGEIVYLDTFAAQFIEPVEEFEIALRHHILVFEPEVEDITEQEEVLYLVFQLSKELHDQFFPKAAIVIGGDGEMHIGDETGVSLDDNRILKGFHSIVF